MKKSYWQKTNDEKVSEWENSKGFLGMTPRGMVDYIESLEMQIHGKNKIQKIIKILLTKTPK